MIHAYPEFMLHRAQTVLGSAFDYAIHGCKLSGNDFVMLFTGSRICTAMENGESKFLLGKSGVEIVLELLEEVLGQQRQPEPYETFSRSVAYWCGWAVAYYQWYSDRRYSQIFHAVSYDELAAMYYPLHEADISKFVQGMEERLQAAFPETNLKRIRTRCGYTQAELAQRAEVSLRSIQMYEQRRKDINRASVESVYSLSKALGCTIPDLIERTAT